MDVASLEQFVLDLANTEPSEPIGLALISNGTGGLRWGCWKAASPQQSNTC